MRTTAAVALLVLMAVSAAIAADDQPPLVQKGDLDERCPAVVDMTGARPSEYTPIHNPPPLYPDFMLKAGREGSVRVLVLIGVDGSVLDASVLRSTGSIFNYQALAAVRKWRWQPYVQEGSPACVRTEVEIVFRLR